MLKHRINNNNVIIGLRATHSFIFYVRGRCKQVFFIPVWCLCVIFIRLYSYFDVW